MKIVRNIFLAFLLLIGVAVLFLVTAIVLDGRGDEARLAAVTNTSIPAADGPPVAAYVAEPSSEDPVPAVIMLHEFWGLRESIVGKAELLAEEGYLVVAPDTYRGAVTESLPRAIYLALSTPQARVDRDLDAVFAWLAAQPNVDPDRIMVMGFCYGGGKALRYSLHNKELAATGIFYGELMDDPATVSGLPGPVLGIFGAEDQRPSPEDVAGFRMALEAAGVPHQLTVYDGVGHAFVEDAAGIRSGGAQGEAWAEFVAFADRVLKN
jgi:carboxymethylenebutenolidase